MCIHIHIKVYASLCLVWKSSFPHSSVQQKVAPPNNEKILKRRICVMGPSSSKVVGTWCWCIYQCQFLNGITATVYIYIYVFQLDAVPIWSDLGELPFKVTSWVIFTRYAWCPTTNSSVSCQALVENNRSLLTNSFRFWTINALGTQIYQQQMIVLGGFGGSVGRSSHTRLFLSACSLRLAVLCIHLESRWYSSHALV